MRHRIKLTLANFDAEFINCTFEVYNDRQTGKIRPIRMKFYNSDNMNITQALNRIGLIPQCIQYVRNNFQYALLTKWAK